MPATDKPKLARGPIWLREAIAKLGDHVEANAPVSSHEVEVVSTPKGKVLFTPGQKSGSGASVGHPWKVVRGSGTSFTLKSGTVNAMVPSNMTASFTATTAGKWVWIKATLNSEGTITALILQSNNTPPTPPTGWFAADAAPTIAYYPLCKVTSVSGEISDIDQVVKTNIALSRSTVAVSCALNKYQLVWTE